MGRRLDKVEETQREASLRKQQIVFNRTLSDDLPESFKCGLCEKDATLVRLTPKVAVYYHECPAYDGIKQLHNNIALWVKRSFGTFNVEHGVIQVDINE